MTAPPTLPQSTSSTEFVAVVLAATVGTRLFPLTSAQSLPKHVLPICGIPAVIRLLDSLQASGFAQTVLVIAHDDTVTTTILKEYHYQEIATKPHVIYEVASRHRVIVLRLGDDCSGSVEALRRVEAACVIEKTSHIMVVPGDLVVLDVTAMGAFIDTHRGGGGGGGKSSVAATILLNDVGEVDEHGIPLKESAKQKKGGLARDEDDIEYMALSFAVEKPRSNAARVLWKQSKLDVEEDKDMVGASPKLILPKPRLRHGITRVRTDWDDLHVYLLAPWVRQLVLARKSLLSLQADLIPLLISRQFKGIQETFGSKADKEILDEVLKAERSSLADHSDQPSSQSPAVPSSSPASKTPGQHEYSVVAYIDKAALRSHSIASYIYACKELVIKAVDSPQSGPHLSLPEGTAIRDKFGTILLADSKLGDKVNYKSSVIGRRCLLGAKVRLNNVVLLDDVVVGDNTVLQNTVVGAGCTIGENCNLNECQVGPGKTIAPGTKEKGESFLNMA